MYGFCVSVLVNMCTSLQHFISILIRDVTGVARFYLAKLYLWVCFNVGAISILQKFSVLFHY